MELTELKGIGKATIKKLNSNNIYSITDLITTLPVSYDILKLSDSYLEKNAFLICTDSFHSSVFAILYSRPFIVFDREDRHEKMNSRLETLLSKFKLENRWYKCHIEEQQLKVDYTETYKILDIERKKSEDFLKRALDLK